MQEILVVNRKSNVATSYVSRSISARLLEPLHYLQDQGLLKFSIVFPTQLRRQREVDWAFFNKAMDVESLSFAKELKSKGTRLLYDIDDHILAYPSYSGAKPSLQNLEIIHEFLQLCDVVTGANEHILQLYREHCPLIGLLTNGIYIERYQWPEKTYFPTNELRIGMVNADFLKIVKFKSDWLGAVKLIQDRYPNLRFMYYGDFPPDVLGLDNWEWLGSVNFDDYRHSLFSRVFDIGLVPLGGSEDPESFQFNLCKNPFKFIEFGAASIPSVYSDVPVYRSVVTDGDNGFLADNRIESWVEKVLLLVENSDLRHQIAQAAQTEVREKLHIRHAAEELLNHIK